MKSFIATFYKTLVKAEQALKTKESIWGKGKFIILEDRNGYYLISKKQWNFLFCKP